jgi:hypothetical protein
LFEGSAKKGLGRQVQPSGKVTGNTGGPAPATWIPEKLVCILWQEDSSLSMPLVFEKEGFRFAFYSNDHKPIHVHVRRAGAEAIFDVDEEVELRES